MKRKSRTAKHSALLGCGASVACVAVLWLTITPAPSPALADEIDQALQQDPCVGFADSWPARFYVWEKTAWDKNRSLLWFITGPWLGSDRSTVKVRFHEIATPGLYAQGRHMLRAEQEDLWLDSTNHMVVTATYDVRTRTLTSLRCAPNGGQASATHP